MANTLYEFYTAKGEKLPSIQERAKTFESSGLGSASTYRGSAQQNIALLGALKKPVAPQKVDVPAVVDVKDLEPPEPNVPVQETAEDVQASADKEVVETAKTQRKTSEAFVSDLIKESKIPLAEETERDSLTAQLKESLEAAKGKGKALVAEEEKLGVPENIKKLQELNQQMAQLEAGLKIGEVGLEGKPILTQQIAGKKALLRRQALAEISGVASIAQAVQGNIELAQATAKRAIDLEFAPAEQEISNLTTLLDLNYQNLTIADKKRADQLNLKLQARQNDIDEQKSEKQNISNIMIKAAENGANEATLEKIRNSKDLMSAITYARGFLSKEDESVDFGVIGQLIDEYGNSKNTYGFIDKVNQTVTSIGGNSVTYDSSGSFTSVDNGIVGGYDISSYATDPNHENAISTILSTMGQFKTKEDVQNYITKVAPTSKITAEMILESSKQNGVSWEMLVAMMQQDSSLGTKGMGARNNNPGNIAQYDDLKQPVAGYKTLQEGVNAVGAWLKRHKVTSTVSDTAGGVKTKAQEIAEGIFNGTSTLKPSDYGKLKGEVDRELGLLKARALAEGNIEGVMRASAGGKDVDATWLQSFEKGMNVIYQLGDLSSSLDNGATLADGTVVPEATGPIWGIIRSNNPYDTKAQLIKAQLQAIVPNLARGVYGEVGVLTDNDIKNYAQTLPNLKSTEEVRNAVLGITVKSVQRSLENKIRSAAGVGRDMSGLTGIYNEIKNTADSLLPTDKVKPPLSSFTSPLNKYVR